MDNLYSDRFVKTQFFKIACPAAGGSEKQSFGFCYINKQTIKRKPVINLRQLASQYLNVTIFVIVIGSFFVFYSVHHNSMLLTLRKKIHMFNCSTYCLCPIRIATHGSTFLLNENF